VRQTDGARRPRRGLRATADEAEKTRYHRLVGLNQIVLIVEDQPQVARALELALELEGHPSLWAPGPDEAFEIIDREPGIRLVIQDMNFSPGRTEGEEGVELFRRVRRLRPDLPVMLVTAWGSLEVAVRLMQEGAADYIEKPWDDERLASSVRTQLRLVELAGERRKADVGAQWLRDELAERADLCGVVYASAAMHEIVSLAVKVARADVPVLITGPNGAGKERIADIIQANSSRNERPWIKVNAAALPADLIEAELFGAEPGAFTGASRIRVGRFETADGGTLLLDEIAELPPPGQTKLLRVLQTGELERLGSSTTRRVNVRVIAATNADLQEALSDGRIREDLLYRLNVIEIYVPGLAERAADIEPLARHFLARHRVECGRPELELGAEALRALEAFSWPGNVRELENRIRRACLVATVDEVDRVDLGLDDDSTSGVPEHFERTGESARIEAALRSSGGVVSGAAKILGISRQALYRRMERLGIVIERRPRPATPDDR
jgi:DNA-binding NtrC family response regulator